MIKYNAKWPSEHKSTAFLFQSQTIDSLIRATDWAARHLRAKYDSTGDWGDAIRAWNGGSPRTRDELVCRVQAKLQVANPASRLLEREQCGTRFARDRRSGAALLEVAEAGDR